MQLIPLSRNRPGNLAMKQLADVPDEFPEVVEGLGIVIPEQSSELRKGQVHSAENAICSGRPQASTSRRYFETHELAGGRCKEFHDDY